MKRYFLVLLALLLPIGLWAEPQRETPEQFTVVDSLDVPDPEKQPDDPYWQWVFDRYGIAPIVTSYEWGGGINYVQSLRLALAGGEEFEVIGRIWDEALAKELIEGGVLIPLDDLLAKYCPSIWNQVSEDQWDLVRAFAPDRKVYFIPRWYSNVTTIYSTRCGMIRQDWLDAVGKKVPTTRDELVEVYRAFRDQDPNGNGEKDEIPVSGREHMRWCDDLFLMHGVHIWEGYPQWHWDAEKKQLVCDQVSDEMRNAIEFIRGLVAEGLMDPVLTTQSSSDWVAKINADRVGHYYHRFEQIGGFSTFAENKPDAGWTYMPLPRVPGLAKMHYMWPALANPLVGITKWCKDPRAIMEFMNKTNAPPDKVDKEWTMFVNFGIEGKDWTWEDESVGKVEVLDEQGQLNWKYYLYRNFNNAEIEEKLIRQQFLGDNVIRIKEALVADGGCVTIGNDGMPVTVYDGFPDHLPTVAKLYREYCTKMVMGQLPMSAWDEYVGKWYEQGGDTVTERATAWYKQVHGID